MFFHFYDLYTQLLRHPFCKIFEIKKKEHIIQIRFQIHFNNIYEYLYLNIEYSHSTKLDHYIFYNWKLYLFEKTLLIFNNINDIMNILFFEYWKWKTFLICKQMKLSPYYLKKHFNLNLDIHSWSNQSICEYNDVYDKYN